MAEAYKYYGAEWLFYDILLTLHCHNCGIHIFEKAFCFILIPKSPISLTEDGAVEMLMLCHIHASLSSGADITSAWGVAVLILFWRLAMPGIDKHCCLTLSVFITFYRSARGKSGTEKL